MGQPFVVYPVVARNKQGKFDAGSQPWKATQDKIIRQAFERQAALGLFSVDLFQFFAFVLVDSDEQGPVGVVINALLA